MIIAELHGKSESSASSYEVSEDILTSNVFQLIRYLPTSIGLIALINEIFEDNKIKVKLDPGKKWDVNYDFWPLGTEIGREPDLLLQLESESDCYAVVIEAKYFSGPSDTENVDDETGAISGNQLSDQFIDLLEGNYKIKGKIKKLNASKEKRYILYLTKHSIKPKEELEKSINQFYNSDGNQGIDFHDYLLWTNWTKIWSVLKKINNYDFPIPIIINDLIDLLEKRGFKDFTGFTLEDWNVKKFSFWKERWFNYKHQKFNIYESSFFEQNN